MTNWSSRLSALIPGGCHTYSRGSDQFPSNAPQMLDRGDGCHVWDAEGRKFLDYGMGLRSVGLGYCFEPVLEQVNKELYKGNNLPRATRTELEAAEKFVSLFDFVDMVKFAKNGSNVTTGALKLARAFTGKKLIAIPRQQPFFSFDDWFIGSTEIKRGIPSEHSSNTLLFDYGDIDSVIALFEEHEGHIAAILLEPVTHLFPCSAECSDPIISGLSKCLQCPNKSKNFLHQLKVVCEKYNALLIFDEMITGFRFDIGGAAAFFGVEPDLCTFGKAMANGFSVAALGGRQEIMSLGGIERADQERTFLMSTTHGAEMIGLRAFVATASFYETNPVIDHLWDYGVRLKRGFESLITKHSLTEYFKIYGSPVTLNFLALNSYAQEDRALKTLFLQEMVKNGVLMSWISVSYSHGERELKYTLDAIDHSLTVCKQALGDVPSYLNGPEIKPVFRRYN